MYLFMYLCIYLYIYQVDSSDYSQSCRARALLGQY